MMTTLTTTTTTIILLIITTMTMTAHALCRVQWLSGRASGSRLREPGFESCAAVLKPLARLFPLYIATVHSAI